MERLNARISPRISPGIKRPDSKIVVGRTVFYLSQLFTKFKCPKDGPFGQIFASPFVFSTYDHGC